jgi:tRNA threonylcarbamoyladenosine biosynthesis protein TsaE
MKKSLEEYDTSSPEETALIARRLAVELKAGSVVALTGPLGSGKTVFVKGLASGLGHSRRQATSPTFSLINEYGGDPPLFHVDLYRLESPAEVRELGLEEYLDGPGIVAVEWAERAADLLPADRVIVRFQRLGPRQRRVSIERP